MGGYWSPGVSMVKKRMSKVGAMKKGKTLGREPLMAGIVRGSIFVQLHGR